MSDISRRGLVFGTVAVAAAAVPSVPSLGKVLATGVDKTSLARPLLAWAVGRDESVGFCPAETEAEARWLTIREMNYGRCDNPESVDVAENCQFSDTGAHTCTEFSPCYERCTHCTADTCVCLGEVDVSRVPAWDGKEQVSAVDWYEAGFGSWCQDCRPYLTLEENVLPLGEGYVVDGRLICSECWRENGRPPHAHMRTDIPEETEK